MPRKIAMVGTTETGAAAPFDKEDWEIWGVSSRMKYVTRATRWFELHRLSGEPEDWAKQWREQMKTFTRDVELFMFYPEPDLGPKVTLYPHGHIVDRFGSFFMTSSFSWMMALAIDEMAPRGQISEEGNEIAIFGVEMEHGTEYRKQRVGLRHFITLANILGIKVSRIASGGLAYEPVPYPLWQDDPLLSKLEKRSEETRTSLQTYEDSLRMTRDMIAQTKGAINEINQSQIENYSREERSKALQKQLDNLLDTSASLSHSIAQAEAVWAEQQWFADYLAP